MEILSLYGEFLYIILGYEKRRIRTNKFWTKNYLLTFNETLDLCLELVHHLNDFQNSDINRDLINRCYIKIKKIYYTDLIINTSDNYENNISFESSKLNIINQAIELLIKQIKEVIHQRNKRYKEEVRRLLMAAHNFPRFYLVGNGYLFNHRGLRLSLNQIISYSKLSLSDFEISKFFDDNELTKNTSH